MKKLVLLVMFSTVFIGTASQAAYEANLFAVRYYGSSGQCGPADDLPYADDAMYGFRDGLLDNGYSSSYVRTYYDSSVLSPAWTETDHYSWGRDATAYKGVDRADVVYYAGHGESSCQTYPVGYQYSRILMGKNTYDCRPQTLKSNGAGGHMEFGSTSSSSEEMDMLFFTACATVQKCAWMQGAYEHLNNGAPHGNNGYGFKAMFGFSGEGELTPLSRAKMKDFVKDSISNGIGDNWIDENSRNRLGWDICAAVMIFGETKAKSDNLYDNGGFKDIKTIGYYNGSTYYRESGCDSWDY